MNTIEQLNQICFPRLKAYYSDLFVHDKSEINRYPRKTPFIHTTRDYGTRLTMLIPGDYYPKKGENVPYLFGHADRSRILEQLDSGLIHDKRENKNALVLYFDGTIFRQVSYDKALKIVQEHMAKIKQEWDKE